MTFVSAEHEQFYNDNLSIVAKGKDYEALVYTLGIDDDCRERFFHMYDPKTRCINPDVIYEGWQTGGTLGITRLAFHLFTGTVAAGDDPYYYSPRRLLYCLDEIHRQGALLALAYFA